MAYAAERRHAKTFQDCTKIEDLRTMRKLRTKLVRQRRKFWNNNNRIDNTRILKAAETTNQLPEIFLGRVHHLWTKSRISTPEKHEVEI